MQWRQQMLDATPALARAHSAHLDAQRHAAQARSERIEDIADSYRAQLLAGNFSAPVQCWNRCDSVAQVVSEELVDMPGNVLHDILALIAEQANYGNAKAQRIVERLTWEHATTTVELRAAKGLA
jgi:hypothetical protein